MITTRRFMMLRKNDVTGVSGVGHVADGVIFSDGVTVIRWRSEHKSTTVYANVEDALKIHGHDGKTTFQFLDDDAKQAWLCCMCFADMDIPTNHCFQCGSGGSRVAMDPSQLDAIQKHDRQRLESIDKAYKELASLRRVAFDVFGPVMLGLVVEKHTDGTLSGVRRRGSSTIHCGRAEEGETVETFLARKVEHVEFDPEEIRRLHKGRKEA